MCTNMRLKTMAPSEKHSTAMPETLFRWVGNCDHRQLSTGTELIERQETGMTR